ncbi:MAG: hypothetical protein ACOCN1_03270 [Bacteroidales bacterium]
MKNIKEKGKICPVEVKNASVGRRVGVGDNRCWEVWKFFATVVESTVVAKRCDLKHDDAEFLLRN